MTYVSQYSTGYSSAAPSESYLFMRPKGARLDGTTPVVIGVHGHGGSSLQFSPLTSSLGLHVSSLVDAGYAFLSCDAGGVSAWGDAAAMSRLDDIVTFAGYIGCKTSKVGVMGWSMGGGASLNWIKRNAARVASAWLWTPATDLDFFNGTAGYVPAYSTAGTTAGGYTAEITADFNPYATASVGYRIHDEPASWRGVAPIRIAHASDDTTIPIGQSQAFVAAVNDPAVTLKTIATGGHTGLFAGATPLEVIQHFKASLT